MNENRLTDYLHHMEQAATDACGFVEGLAKDGFHPQMTETVPYTVFNRRCSKSR